MARTLVPQAPDERIHREPRRPPSPHLTPPAFGSARHKARPHPIRSSVRRSSHQASRSLCGGTEKMPHGINSSEARETWLRVKWIKNGAGLTNARGTAFNRTRYQYRLGRRQRQHQAPNTDAVQIRIGGAAPPRRG